MNNSPLYTGLPALGPCCLPDALRRFCERTPGYRSRYLQQHFGPALEGYSFPGQEDSLNQGPEDALHSFVLSDNFPIERYPPELQSFLSQQWPTITRSVHLLEQQILARLGLKDIANQHRQLFQHTLSANYFPALPQPGAGRAHDATTPAKLLRLSAHPDVSLLTVFFNGLSEGFQYRNADQQWVDAPVTSTITVFPGELLEWMTDGAISALQHRVRTTSAGIERFSFALFSLPAPDAVLTSNAGQTITTEQWHRKHLEQWDSPAL